MTRRTRALIYLSAATFSLLMLGFLVFASSATRRVLQPSGSADAIVVLTGGSEGRIDAGMKLLRRGLGERLLISGVNRKLKRDELFAQLDQPAPCCIDLGYEALDTVGNAAEASRWAARHDFKRLIVVTSSYHMPRSLNELALAMPDVELLAHAVRPRAFSEGAWWLRPGAARILLSEYLKLIPSYARLVLHRMIGTMMAVANLSPSRPQVQTAVR